MDINALATTLASSPNLAAIGIAFFMLLFGVRLLTGLSNDSPLSDHVLPILGSVLAGPLIMTLAILGHIGNEALTGFVGAMVGFFFGAQRSETANRNKQIADSSNEQRTQMDKQKDAATNKSAKS
jgi:hypothetical protein